MPRTTNYPPAASSAHAAQNIRAQIRYWQASATADQQQQQLAQLAALDGHTAAAYISVNKLLGQLYVELRQEHEATEARHKALARAREVMDAASAARRA